jgi:hypothetical protein
MENIKEELRQLIKEKILSTIMEGKKSKKSKKPIHLPRGPDKPLSKAWSGDVKTGSENTKQRREGREQAAQLDENEYVTLGAMAGTFLGTGIVGLGVEALRRKFGDPKRIKKLKANLIPTQKTPTVGIPVSPNKADQNNQYKLQYSRLASTELRRAQAEGRTPRIITPEQVNTSITDSQNRGLRAVTNRTNRNLP